MSIFFSIIIPTYNRAHLIKPTLVSAININYTNYEIIVIDDGSTDNTEQMVLELRSEKVAYYKKTNGERGAARNYGAKLAKGDYVNFFDSDDLLLPNHLSEALKTIEENKNPEWFHLNYNVDNKSNHALHPKKIGDNVNQKLIFGNPLSCNGVFIRKDIFEKNNFNENRTLSASEDWELWLRLAAQYKLYLNQTVTSVIINHDERSVLTFNVEKLIENKLLLNQIVSQNKLLKEYYKSRIQEFEASNFSYISLHCSLSGHYKATVLNYFFKAFFKSPKIIFSKRTLAIWKHFLFGVFKKKNDLITSFIECKRCLLNSSITPIKLDKEGNCNYCNEYVSMNNVPAEKKEIDTLINTIKNKTSLSEKQKYNCVVGVSGGADSSYLVSKCVEWGLKPLLVHMDNGWNTTEAFENIELLCKKFNLDLDTHVLDWEDFSNVQKAHLLASVPEIETPTDIAILHCLYKSAAKHKIKTILLGCNNKTEGFFINQWHYNPRDAFYTKDIIKKHATQPVKNLYLLPFHKELYFKYFLCIKTFYPFNYFEYNKNEVLEKLNEIGWKSYGAKHHESAFTKLVQSYILPIKFKIDYRVLFLSVSVINNQITKEQAKKQLEILPYNNDEIKSLIHYFCKKLKLSETDFYKIMSTAPKNYKAYKNSSNTLKLMYKLYSLLFFKDYRQIR